MSAVWAAWFALLTGTNAWVACGALEPLVDRQPLVYVFAAPPWWHLPAWWLAAVLAAWAVWRRGWPPLREVGAAPAVPRIRLAAAAMLALPLVTIASLASPLRSLASPWVYFFVDLHPWLLGGTAVLVLADLDAAAGRPFWRRLRALVARVGLPGTDEAWLEAALVAALLAASLATSPIFRFQSAVIGDEPKYVRYLENWYRGRGLDVEGLAPIGDLGPDDRPKLLANLRHARDAAVQVAVDLGHEAGRVVGAKVPARPGPARGAGGWFVTGRRGGVYQVHNPGLPFLLLPAYVVDRAFLNWTSDFHPQLPSDLYCTATTVVVIYLAWGIAVFRLLRVYTGRTALAWAVSALVTLGLPTAAFAYQYYPEVAAGLAIAVLARFVLLIPASGRRVAVVYGLLAGFLPWLHVRFGLVALVLVALCLAAASRRREWRPAVAFVVGFLVPIGALAAYYFHVTGSVMPWALHALCADEAAPFNLTRALHDVPNYWFDGNGGLLAHAPFYLLAVPGLWLMWRRSRFVAGGLALLVLALAVPAAGHGWVGGGTTPLRLVAAVVPLLALPLAEAIGRFGASRWFAAALAILSVVGLQNAWTYSTHLIKSEPWLIGPVSGGWLFPLLFPGASEAARWYELPFWIWAALTVALFAWPRFVVGIPPVGELAPPGRRPLSVAVASLLVAAAAAASGLGWWTGQDTQTRFMPDQHTVRHRLLVRDHSRLGGSYWLSTGTRVNLNDLLPNEESVPVSVGVEPAVVPIGTPVTVSVAGPIRERRPPWGRVRVEFGDHTPAESRRFVGRFTTEHRYRTPGDYPVRIDVDLPGRLPVGYEGRVQVEPVPAAPVLPREAVQALPSEVLARPGVVAIDELRIGERHLDLRCRLVRHVDDPRFWAWIVWPGPRGPATEFQLGTVRQAGLDANAFWVRIPHPWSAEDPDLVGVMVGVARGGRAGMEGRSDVAAFYWPGRLMTVGGDLSESIGVSTR